MKASSHRKANRFISAARKDVLEREKIFAKIILHAKANGYKPSQLSKVLDSHFRTNFAELNPLENLDAYGIEQILAKLAPQKDLKGIKAYFKSAIDAWVKTKSKIDEGFVRSFFESLYLDEEELQSFNVEELKSMPTLESKLAYIQQNLEKIGSGSSRLAFAVNPTTIIKIARNKKGMAQNQSEINISNSNSPLIAKVLAFDEHGTWIESERASKDNFDQLFENYTGYRFKPFAAVLRLVLEENNQKNYIMPNDLKKSYQHIIQSEFFKNVVMLATEFNIAYGDLIKSSSWGIIVKDDRPVPVMIDYGLTKDIWNAYYKKTK